MDDRTPSDPHPASVVVPNPHTGTPLPDAPLGARTPEGEAVVRPEQEEPSGPLEGLLSMAASEAESEATAGESDDASLLEQMGVEEEGIEGGQILGLVIATVVAVLALAVVLIYLFYIPRLQQVESRASNVGMYPELEQVRTEGLAKLNQYSRTDSVAYGVPVERAMALVARDYAAEGVPAAGLPTTSQEFNTLMINRGTGGTVGVPGASDGLILPEQARLQALQGARILADTVGGPRVERNVEVGVDVDPSRVGVMPITPTR